MMAFSHDSPRLALLGGHDEELGWDLGDVPAAALGALGFCSLVLGKAFGAGEPCAALVTSVVVGRHGALAIFSLSTHSTASSAVSSSMAVG